MKKLLFTTAALTLVGAALADDPTPAQKLKTPATEALGAAAGKTLPETIVTATRTPEDPAKIGSAVTRIDRDEIERTHQIDLQNILATTPGLVSGDAGGRGGFPIIALRGNLPSDTLFLMNGVRVNSSLNQDAHPFTAYAGTQNLQSIEIVRGPQSTLYGSDGLGGVISLDSPRGQGAPSVGVYGEAGSFDSFREGFNSQGELGKAAYAVGYERDDTASSRPNNALWLNRYSFRFDYQLADNLSLRLNFDGIDGHYQEPGSNRPQDYASNDPHALASAQANLVSAILDWKTTEFWNQKLILGANFERYAFTDLPYAGNFYTPTEYVSNDVVYSADWQNTFQLASNNRLIAGLFLSDDIGHDNTFLRSADSDVAGFIQDEYEPVKNLNLTAGGRFDHYQIGGDAPTYRFTGSYLAPLSDTKFRSSFGTAFTAPSLLELYSTSPFELGNRNLQPARSRGWDAGVDQYLLDRHVVLSATYFQDRVHDLIAFVPTSLATGSYVNRDRANNQGVELGAEATLVGDWKSRLSYTWLNSTQDVAGTEQRRVQLPRHDLALDTSYLFFKKWLVGAGVSYEAGLVDTDFSVSPSKEVKLQDYWLVRLYTRYAVNDHLSLTVRAENVTNSHYENALGYPGLPIGVYGGAEMKF